MIKVELTENVSLFDTFFFIFLSLGTQMAQEQVCDWPSVASESANPLLFRLLQTGSQLGGGGLAFEWRVFSK
jgi:hypothetical protein